VYFGPCIFHSELLAPKIKKLTKLRKSTTVWQTPFFKKWGKNSIFYPDFSLQEAPTV